MPRKTEPVPTPRAAPASCCSTFYEQDWVRQIADNVFHPGGAELTHRTIAAMKLPAQARILDLGCGTGSTAMLLACDNALQVSAVDISAANIERAIERAEAEGIAIRFCQADAHKLPFADGELDAVLAECTFSLFSNQAGVLAEIRRVLKPGGKLAITDMALGGILPDDIAAVLAPWTCLADAVDQETYTEMLLSAGFEIQTFADESAGLLAMVQILKRKLLVLGTGAFLTNNEIPGFDLTNIKFWLNRFETEVKRGIIRYLRFNLKI